MKCFSHPTVDAVGLCSQCGRAGCTTCLQDVGGAIWCRSCLFRREIRYEAETIAQRWHRTGGVRRKSDGRSAVRANGKAAALLSAVDAKKARSRIVVSFVVAAIGFCLGLPGSNTTLPPESRSSTAAFVFAYVFWASYWDIPYMWRY
jgi:hypothetical protein